MVFPLVAVARYAPAEPRTAQREAVA